MKSIHTLEEDAPKVLGHSSNSKWVMGATERRTPLSGGVHKNCGNEKLRRNSTQPTKEFKGGRDKTKT